MKSSELRAKRASLKRRSNARVAIGAAPNAFGSSLIGRSAEPNGFGDPPNGKSAALEGFGRPPIAISRLL